MKISEVHHLLSQVRKERGLYQQDIAYELNTEQSAISMYETGKRGIPTHLLDRWLELLEIEVIFKSRRNEATESDCAFLRRGKKIFAQGEKENYRRAQRIGQNMGKDQKSVPKKC